MRKANGQLSLWAICTALVLGVMSRPALASEFIASDYLPLSQGRAWIYGVHESSPPEFQRREVTAVREQTVAGSNAPLRFVEVSIYDGKTKTASADRQYLLFTAKGVLASTALGEGAADFWQQAFLLLPREFDVGQTWTTWSQGSQMQFEIVEKKQVQTAAGTFPDCVHVRYRQGLEESGEGHLTFCKDVGEVEVMEGGYRRDLIQFIKAGPPLVVTAVDEKTTDLLWGKMPQGQLVSSKRLEDISGSTASKAGLSLWLVLSFLMVVLAGVGWFYLRKIRVDDVAMDDQAVNRQLQQVVVERDAGDWQRAHEKLEELLRLYPNYADVHYHMGLTKMTGSEAESALSHFQEAVRINPKYVDAHLQLGFLLREKRHFEQALESFLQVLAMRPDYADIHNLTGELWRDLGNLEKAREHFERALAINPHFENARLNLQSRL